MSVAVAVRNDAAKVLTTYELVVVAGIRPWSNDAIEDHKMREQAKAPRNFWSYVEPHLGTMAHGAFLLGGLFLLATIFSVVLLGEFGLPHLALSLSGVEIALAAFFVLVAWLADQAHLSGLGGLLVVREAVWETKSLQWHREPLPKEALKTVATISALAPGTTFYISVLRQGERILDPILHASTPDGEYLHVLVWDGAGRVVEPHD